MATSFQIKKIHTLKNILSIDDDLYREMLLTFNVNTSKKLDFTNASKFIEILEEKAIAINKWTRQQKKYAGLNRSDNMASDAQLRMIESLWRELSYYNNDKFAKKSLRKFLKLRFKINDVMFLTRIKANKVIHGIIAMKKNVEKSAATLN
ncbi:MAG TPA: regulatory protein GemA [Candidatus Adamsella sp.]|nr:regulatory protein GemA [Candidatus Adamsella sp.]